MEKEIADKVDFCSTECKTEFLKQKDLEAEKEAKKGYLSIFKELAKTIKER